MKKMLAMVTCSFLAVCLLAPLALAQDSPMTASGKAVQIDAEHGRLTVQTEDGHSMVFQVDGSTQVTRDESPVTLADIVAGDRLTVDYKKSGETNVALVIGVHEAKA